MKTIRNILMIMIVPVFALSMTACKKENCADATTKLAAAATKYADNPTAANEKAWKEALEKASKVCGVK